MKQETDIRRRRKRGMTMYIIVGLGNFGKEYNNTRHNIGFDIIDTLFPDAKLPHRKAYIIGKNNQPGGLVHLIIVQKLRTIIEQGADAAMNLFNSTK